MSTTTSPSSWSPPPAPCFEINFDGAVFKESYEVGVGVIARDSNGLVCASVSEKIPLPPSSDDVEALVVARAILFAQELGLSSMIFEGDSLVVINTLNSTEEYNRWHLMVMFWKQFNLL